MTPFLGVTIGFNQTIYSVNEGAGSVDTTISILNGMLAKNVFVMMVFTSDATASSAGG